MLITKDEIKKSIEFDKTTYLYMEISEFNKNIGNIDDELVGEIYNIHMDEMIHNNARCGSVFKKHFWTSIYMRVRALLINSLSGAWWGIQLAPPIANFIKNLDGAALSDALASFTFDLPEFVKPFVKDTIKTIKEFKIKTKCKNIFVVWTKGIVI